MPGETEGWTIYAIALKRSVLNDKKFLRANPQHVAGKPCVYVGLTFRKAEERFDQHMTGIHSARIVRKFGKRVRSAECKRIKAMTRARAEEKEAAHAKSFRNRGWGVWSN